MFDMYTTSVQFHLLGLLTNMYPAFLEKDPRIVRNIMEDKTLMSIAWQISKGMEHLANMKVNNRVFHNKKICQI